MMTDLHAVTALFGYLALVLYFWRTGTLLRGIPGSEQTARIGVGIVLIAVSLGLTQRAHSGDPFLWFHWLLLAGLACMVGGYVGLYVQTRGKPPLRR